MRSTWGAPSPGAVEETCVVCGAAHGLPDCPTFCQLPVGQRRDCIRDQKRCYRCCGANHRAAMCGSSEACASCGSMAHHSLLHPNPTAGGDRSTVTTVASNAAASATGQKLLQLSGTAPAPSSSDNAPPSPQVSVSAVDGAGNGGKCFRPILPVMVEFEDGACLKTYALLDSGSVSYTHLTLPTKRIV